MNLREMIGEERLAKGLWWGKGVNLVTGCTRVSLACDNCWSLKMQERFQKEEPGVIFHASRLKAFRRKKPMVFSVWNDLFHEDLDGDALRATFTEMIHNPQHVYIVLTKRPYFTFERHDYEDMKEVKNLWLGTTVESSEHLHRIDELLRFQSYASKLFVSVEPMLGEVDLIKYAHDNLINWCEIQAENDVNDIYICDSCGDEGLVQANEHYCDWINETDELIECPDCQLNRLRYKRYLLKRYMPLDLIISGSESGTSRRPTNIEWIRSLRDQCQSAGVPFFLKQMEIDGKLVKAPELDGRQWLKLPAMEE